MESGANVESKWILLQGLLGNLTVMESSSPMVFLIEYDGKERKKRFCSIRREQLSYCACSLTEKREVDRVGT